MADILIIDDEENIAFSLKLALSRSGHTCRIASTGRDAMERLGEHPPDIALLDIQLPDASGLDLLPRIREAGPDVGVIVLTAFGTVSSAVAAMKAGAMDFLQKPLSTETVQLAVERCLEGRRLRRRLSAYEEAQRYEGGSIEVVGQSPEMLQVLSTADKIAAMPEEPGATLTSILLTGETGTGKEVIARYIHARSARAGNPFLHVNCTAIPQSLFESELFGHESGTFTDAKTPKKGLLETAHEGTLFLDEVGDMPLAIQAKLLTAIESGRFRRLGATTERVANVRVIAATNTPLLRRVREGQFREDLYYRLTVFTIDLPPLRSRGDDLFLLTQHFLQKYCRQQHRPVPALSDETRRCMQSYDWPGNVRELANVLQRAVLLGEGSVLEPGLLGLQSAEADPQTGPDAEFDFARRDCSMRAVEQRLLTAALDKTGGNISEAARLLGLTRGSLRHRLEKFHIPIPPTGEG